MWKNKQLLLKEVKILITIIVITNISIINLSFTQVDIIFSKVGGHMNQKFIFIDVDGTLFHHGQGTPQSAINAIKQAQNIGHKVFICTGRAHCEIDKEIREIGFDGYISSCGAVVEVENKLIDVKPLEMTTLKETVQLMNDMGIDYKLEGVEKCFLTDGCYKLFSGFFFDENDRDHSKTEAYIREIGTRKINEYDFDPKHQIAKLSIFSQSLPTLQAFGEKIKDIYHHVLQAENESDFYGGEVYDKHVSKASGIDQILNYYGADKSQSIAIGDSLNDLEMVQHCDIGIAMGNGVHQLKEVADFVTKHILEDGMQYAFQELKLI